MCVRVCEPAPVTECVCRLVCQRVGGYMCEYVCVYICTSVSSVGSIGMMRCVMKKNEPVYT